MTAHVIASYDHEQTMYNQRNIIRTTYYQSNRNDFYHSPLPIPSIDVCENLLYEKKRFEDGGSATSSSYINSHSEHYDNTLAHTYDNPIDYRENYPFDQSLIQLPDENLYDNAKCEEKSSSKSSSIFLYLENKRLVVYSCLIFICLLTLIVLGIFLLNKFLRPVVIQTTINNHYEPINTTNSATSTFSYSTCPPDRWGSGCGNMCKPCGLGVCHSGTGKCICPVDIYGEFCDLWKVNDQPRRGDMMN